MKKIVLAGLALGALAFGADAASLPAAFNPMSSRPLTGDIAIAGGAFLLTYEGSDNTNGLLFAGLARAQYFFMPNWSAQVDINGESAYDGSDSYNAVFNIAAHVGYHTPAWMVGAMLSKGFNSDAGETFLTAALEGAYRMGPVVLYGQAGYTSWWGGNEHAWYVHKELAYFLNPNLMVSGDLGIAAFGVGSYTGLRAFRWGVGVEKRFNASPFGVFARAEGAFLDWEGGDNRSQAEIKVGFKGYFYDQPLQGGPFRRDFNPCTGVNPLIYGCYYGDK